MTFTVLYWGFQIASPPRGKRTRLWMTGYLCLVSWPARVVLGFWRISWFDAWASRWPLYGCHIVAGSALRSHLLPTFALPVRVSAYTLQELVKRYRAQSQPVPFCHCLSSCLTVICRVQQLRFGVDVTVMSASLIPPPSLLSLLFPQVSFTGFVLLLCEAQDFFLRKFGFLHGFFHPL